VRASEAASAADPATLAAAADTAGFPRLAVRPDTTVLDAAAQLALAGVLAMSPQPPLCVPAPHAVPWRAFWPAQRHAEAEAADPALEVEALAEQAGSQTRAAREETARLLRAAKAAMRGEAEEGAAGKPAQDMVLSKPLAVDESGRPDENSFSTMWGYWWDGVALECDDFGWIGKITIF
jgi:hypothetical protein